LVCSPVINCRSSCEDIIRDMASGGYTQRLCRSYKEHNFDVQFLVIECCKPSIFFCFGRCGDGQCPLADVHEVLKRSRTSGSVMQTALCYLEAIRAKVPQILRDENSGIRSYFMPESAIHPATEAEFQMDRKLSNLDESELSTKLTKTERLTDEDADCETSTGETSTGVPLEGVLIPLPSPPLCPRRPAECS
jgi:hypothetical protein